MRFDVITLFPEMFESPLHSSILKRAQDKGIIEIHLHQLRKWAIDNYGAVDDKPFGGGVGMLMRVEPIYQALQEVKSEIGKKKHRIVLLSARGKRFTQATVERLSQYENITLICGHYEGVDARIENYLVDESLSIGDYVLTGGELPAMVVIDAVSRLVGGVLGKAESHRDESYSKNPTTGKRQREYPQYTRPREFLGMSVPDELLSGDPKIIEDWKKNALKKGK